MNSGSPFTMIYTIPVVDYKSTILVYGYLYDVFKNYKDYINSNIAIITDEDDFLVKLLISNKCKTGIDLIDLNYSITHIFEKYLDPKRSCSFSWDNYDYNLRGEKKKITCREKLKMEHPECTGSKYMAGCKGCPDKYKYAKVPIYCNRYYGNNYEKIKNDIDSSYGVPDSTRCVKCWNRPIEEEE